MIRPQTCPVCSKDLDVGAAQESKLFPFCSVRCQQIDLYRWATGRYAIVEPLERQRLEEMEEMEGMQDEFREDED